MAACAAGCAPARACAGSVAPRAAPHVRLRNFRTKLHTYEILECVVQWKSWLQLFTTRFKWLLWCETVRGNSMLLLPTFLDSKCKHWNLLYYLRSLSKPCWKSFAVTFYGRNLQSFFMIRIAGTRRIYCSILFVKIKARLYRFVIQFRTQGVL